VEDTVATAQGNAEAVVVEHVGAVEGEPVVRSFQREQVRVLAISYTN
jgi:hypothetical protein